MRQIIYFLFLTSILIECKNNEGEKNMKNDEEIKVDTSNTNPAAMVGPMAHDHYYGYYEMKVDKVHIGKEKFDSITSNNIKYRFKKNKLNLDYFQNKSVKVYKVVDSINQDTILLQLNKNLSNNMNVNNKEFGIIVTVLARGRLGCIPTFEFDDSNIVIFDQEDNSELITVTFYFANHERMDDDLVIPCLDQVKFRVNKKDLKKIQRSYEGGLEGPYNYNTADKSNLLVLYDKSGNKVDSINLIPIL